MDKERLRLEIECELDNLSRLANEARKIIEAGDSDKPEWRCLAAAKYVSDLWVGFENLCKRRQKNLDLPAPQGFDSHRQTLEEFFATNGLGAGLSSGLAERLKKYLGFRHRFVHGYGTQITWDMVEEPIRLLPETVGILAQVWRNWLQNPR